MSCSAFVLPDEGIVLEELEADLIRQALERTKGNQSAAARLLGISRYALRYRLAKHGFASPRGADAGADADLAAAAAATGGQP